MYLEGKAADLGLETTLEKKLPSEEVGPGCDEVAPTGSHPPAGTAAVATRLSRKKVQELKRSNERCRTLFRGMHKITGYYSLLVKFILKQAVFWHSAATLTSSRKLLDNVGTFLCWGGPVI